MIFRLNSPGRVEELAGSLAQDIGRRYPSAIANSPEPLVSSERRSQILDQIFSRAGPFTRENRLGMFARLRLGSALKWKLKQMGYDENFIDMATDHLVASLNRDRK